MKLAEGVTTNGWISFWDLLGLFKSVTFEWSMLRWFGVSFSSRMSSKTIDVMSRLALELFIVGGLLVSG